MYVFQHRAKSRTYMHDQYYCRHFVLMFFFNKTSTFFWGGGAKFKSAAGRQ